MFILLFGIGPAAHCLLPTGCFSQPITFEKWYNYGYAETGYAVEQTYDGGYIVAGRQGINVSKSNIELLKTDSLGNVQWAKFIDIDQYLNDGYDVKQTADSGYIITGNIETAINGWNAFLLKTNKYGDTLWTKNYGNSLFDIGFSLMETFDGGYAIAGWKDDSLAMLIKTDSNGDTLWIKTYLPQGMIASSFRNFQQLNDSGYILCGGISPTTATGAMYLVRTNKNGDTLWTKQYSNNVILGYSARETSDGGYIVAGTKWDGVTQYNLYLIKTNSVGDTLWTKTFTNADAALRAMETSDSGYIVLGSTDRIGYGSNDFYLTKINSNGDTLWTKTFGGTNSDFGNDLKITADGGFIMAGWTASFCPGCTYLVKTDSAGNIATSVSEYEENNFPIIIYPNPANDKITILFLKNIREGEILLNDITGRKIRKNKITGMAQEISIADLNNGIYLFQIISENKIFASQKLIIQH